MDNLIIILVIGVILGAAITYIVKEKKKGNKCIGCPDAARCGKADSSFTCGKTDSSDVIHSGGCSGSCANCKGCSQK